VRDNVTSILQREFEAAKEYVPSAKDWLSSYWSGFMSPHQKARIRNTGAGLVRLRAQPKHEPDHQSH
jgi:2-oxoglutarate dehydrogenase E1 component